MNKLDIAKKAVNIVVGAGITKIVSDIIKNNVEPEKTHEIVSVYVAGAALGMMVADATKDYTGRQIDELASWWTETIKPKFNK